MDLEALPPSICRKQASSPSSWWMIAGLCFEPSPIQKYTSKLPRLVVLSQFWASM